MPTIASITELKARLSAYLDIVRQGDEVLVSDRGRVIARLAPVRGEQSAEGRRELLLRSGRLRPPSGGLPADFFARARPKDRKGLGLAALLAERESGW